MRLIFAAVIIFGSTSIASAQYYGEGSNPSAHETSGYYRNNGTYVAPHYQTNPNGSTYDNYQTSGLVPRSVNSPSPVMLPSYLTANLPVT